MQATLKDNVGRQRYEAASLAILEESARPMILLECNQRIFFCNEVARQYLPSQSLLYDDAGILRCRTESGTAELRRGLDVVGIGAYGGRNPRRVALRLEGNHPAKVRIYCSLSSLQPTPSYEPTSITLLTIVPATQNKLTDPVFIGSMFDLTPAEANLAMALVNGGGLKQISAQRQVSLETVRAQLKSIFRKTNTHRQSELIALILRVAAS